MDLKHKHQKEGSQEIELGIDLSEFYLSVEWDIISVPALRKEAFYSCCEEVSCLFPFIYSFLRSTFYISQALFRPIIDLIHNTNVYKSYYLLRENLMMETTTDLITIFFFFSFFISLLIFSHILTSPLI